MKTADEWFFQFSQGRLEDFSLDEMESCTAFIQSIIDDVKPKVDDAMVERMAQAAWNLHGTVPWDEFFRKYPGNKQFYLDTMRAALAVQ